MLDSCRLIWLANMLSNLIQQINNKKKRHVHFIVHKDWLKHFFKKISEFMLLWFNTRGLVGHNLRGYGIFLRNKCFWRGAMWRFIKCIRVGSQEWLMLQAQSDNSQPFVGLCWYFLFTTLHFYRPFHSFFFWLSVPCVVSVSQNNQTNKLPSRHAIK